MGLMSYVSQPSGAAFAYAKEYDQMQSQLSPTEIKLAIEQLKQVKLWGGINEVHPMLPGASFIKADEGDGIIISRKAANDHLSDEAVRLGILHAEEYLAYPASKGSMNIVLFDSPLLRENWFNMLGIKDDQDRKLETLRIERCVNLNWPIYFEPLGILPASHGHLPNPRFAAQRERLDRADHYRSIGHQDIIEKVHQGDQLMLDKTHQLSNIVGIESFDGRMYGLALQDYRPEEGYQMVTDYPNLIPINELDVFEPTERSHAWAVDYLKDMLTQIESYSNENSDLANDHVYKQFYEFGIAAGDKSVNRINQRLVHPNVIPDVMEVPDTDLRSAATAVDMINTIRATMGFMLELYRSRNIIDASNEFEALKGFADGVITTEYPNQYGILIAGQKQLEKQQSELDELMRASDQNLDDPYTESGSDNKNNLQDSISI